MSDKSQGTFSSIFSKGKKSKKQCELIKNISNINYKYMLFKAKDDGAYQSLNTSFAYSAYSDSWKFHVLNPDIGRVLYEALNNNQVNTDEMPEELKLMNFLAVKKLKRVVFVCFDVPFYNNLTSSLDCDKRRILDNIYNIFSWLTDNLSTETMKLNIHYECFFEKYTFTYFNFLKSLFSSIYVSEDSYNFGFSELESVINKLFRTCDELDDFSLEKMRICISEARTPFYYFLKKGIYIKELDEQAFFNLPYNLMINIFKFALDNTRFETPMDFFKENTLEESQDDNVIFDKERFESEISLVAESAKSLIYASNDKGTYSATFMQIKDENAFTEIVQTVKKFAEDNLISDYFVIESNGTEPSYLVRYNDNNNGALTLSEYTERYRNLQYKITNLIAVLNSWYFNSSIAKTKVYVKSGVSLLDIISVDEISYDCYLTSLENICFSKTEGYEAFDYSLCIMQIVKAYMTVNQIPANEINKCDFVKLFPSPFVQLLIKYIEDLTPFDEIKRTISSVGNRWLKNCFNPDEICKIEFLENISVDDVELIQRTTFCDASKQNDLVKKIEAAKQKVLSNESAKYISLDDKISFVTVNGNLTLSKQLLGKLTYCSGFSSFLIPEKVIISKDIFDSKNYTVIGVIWNKNRLYTLDSLVKSKVINTENIYGMIVKDIIKLYGEGYNADKLKAGIGSLLLDDNYNIYFDITSCKSYKDICRSNGKELKAYYTSIMQQIVNEFGNYLENFTFYVYDTLLEEFDEYEDVDDFESIFDKIKFCAEHKKLYLSDTMCEDCLKLYYPVYHLGNIEETHEIGSGIFSSFDDIYGLVWNPKLQKKEAIKYIADRVKLGILNGLYKNFVGLVPEKIVVNQNSQSREIRGIYYDEYDFDEDCIMKLESFKHAQRLKVILTMYKKILPHIYDYSFIVPNKKVFSSMFMDKEYKGEFIIPDLPFIKCEVTISKAESLKEQEKNRTLKLFSEFLYEYITSDEGLNSEIKNNDSCISEIVKAILECNFTEEYIRNYLKSKDAYCKAHGVYFSSSDRFCPECIASGISNKNAVILDKATFDDIVTEDSEYEGGEATLYTTEGGKIQKIFNDTVNASFKAKVIGKAFEKAKLFKEFNRNHDDIKFVLIDKVLYSFDNGILNLEGYTQKFIEGSFKISSLKEKSFVQSQGYTKKDILEILIKVCKAIEFLHSIGVFIGDLNGGNILIKDKKVYIIDMDGMSYDDVRNCVYTDTYIYPPSAESKNITELDDWYSLAIQAFYYLTYSHPFRGICEDDNIPKNEVERMKYGYSILGNHGIKQPAISEGFGLMPKYLIKFFLETFEGNRRESMIEVLQSYLKSVQKSSMEFKKIERQQAVAREITENIYIDTGGLVRYNEIQMFAVGHKIEASTCWNGNECITFLGKNATAVVNEKTGKQYFFDKVYDSIEYAYNNTIYYEGNNDYNIYVDELTTDETIKTYKLQRQTENPVWVMSGNGTNKFVILEENMDDNTYDIYCNSEKICSFSQNDFLQEEIADILYDEISEKWVVYLSCSGKLKLVVIQKNGKYTQNTLETDEIPDSASFYKNTIYFAGEGKIFMYNVNSQSLSSIDCNIATSESSIERKDNKLIITNDKESYMYIKS